jgi:hypothetical protein
LPVGDDDVGVQMRIPTPAGFVLVRDRHQTGQVLQVLLLGDWVVHPRVAGVRGQILHCFGERGGVRVGEPLRSHVVGFQCPDQRDALRGGERQVIPMHALRAQRAAMRAVGRDAVVEPARHHRGIRLTSRALTVGQPHQPGGGMRIIPGA